MKVLGMIMMLVRMKEMLRILRRCFKNTKSQAKYWSEEHQKVNEELSSLKLKCKINEVFTKLIEGAEE